MAEALNNSELAANYHHFSVKNTYTKDKDEQMRMSLTYYAITHLKPALAIETSKNITELKTKVLYQLLSMEALLKHMDITFERDFDLTLEEVERLLARYGTLTINGRFTLPLSTIRNALYFVPMRPQSNIFTFSHPLGTTIDRGSYHQVMIGNIPVARLYPQHFSLTCKAEKAVIEADGALRTVGFGEHITVKKTFKVIEMRHFESISLALLPKTATLKTVYVYKKRILFPASPSTMKSAPIVQNFTTTETTAEPLRLPLSSLASGQKQVHSNRGA